MARAAVDRVPEVARPRRSSCLKHGVTIITLSALSMIATGCGGPSDTPAPTPVPSPSNESTPSPTPGSTPPVNLFQCTSDVTPKPVVNPEKKGFAVDDVTLSGCSDKLVGRWPHADDQVTSIRLFAAWKPNADFDESKREAAWDNIKEYVEATNSKVLLGIDVDCSNRAYEETEFDWALQLMKKLGKDRIMGMSFGNELDTPIPKNSCVNDAFWNDFFDKIVQHVKDMDSAGFASVPVTVVWSMGIVDAIKKVQSHSALTTFLHKAHDTWPDRWVWSFNPYPIWSTNGKPTSSQDCHQITDVMTSLETTKSQMAGARKDVTSFTNNDEARMWITEAGWSSPCVTKASDQARVCQVCPYWASKEVYWKYYDALMSWDLSLGPNLKPVDHLFFFTMRDAKGEGFGVLPTCAETACKRTSDYVDQIML